MDTKTCSQRPPERKTQNVSKSYYLFYFKHILVLPSALKMWLFSSKILPWLPWPPFGHPGVLNKPLGWHLQAILGAPGLPPRSPTAFREYPRRVLKVIPNPFLSLLCLWRVPGMPPGSPLDPKNHQKLRKHSKKYKQKKARWRLCAQRF